MKRYVLAVSGGVDSVVLLHQALNWPDTELIVAHFDHGIRKESARDALFVRTLAGKYKLPFVSERQELGKGASEELARRARYGFLHRIAKGHNAQIVMAHHADDVLETIIINLLRGTGWRGLSSLRSGEVVRPLLEITKQDILAHAKAHKLVWREDHTNADAGYLRNYVRHSIAPNLGEEGRSKLLGLYNQQKGILEQISAEIYPLLRRYYINPGEYRRHPFIMVEPGVGYELLHGAIYKATGKTVTRPQLQRALLATKTFRPGAIFQIGQGIALKFSRDSLIVEETRS